MYFACTAAAMLLIAKETRHVILRPYVMYCTQFFRPQMAQKWHQEAKEATAPVIEGGKSFFILSTFLIYFFSQVYFYDAFV